MRVQRIFLLRASHPLFRLVTGNDRGPEPAFTSRVAAILEAIVRHLMAFTRRSDRIVVLLACVVLIILLGFNFLLLLDLFR